MSHYHFICALIAYRHALLLAFTSVRGSLIVY